MASFDWSIEILENHETNILRIIPNELSELFEVEEIIHSIEKEFNLFYDRVKNAHANFTLDTANEDGIRQWEDFLEIQRYQGDNLDTRRMRVLTRLNERIPYTLIQLYKMLASIVGWENFSLKLEDLTLTINVEAPTRGTVESIIDLLSRVVPLYIVWRVGQRAKLDTTVTSLGFYGIGTHLTVLPIVEHNIETETTTTTNGAIVLGKKIHILPKE